MGGFLIGGPVGAVAGGIGAGATMDGVMTGVESAVNGKFTPSGSIAAVEHAIRNPSGGSIFDALAVPVFDGVAGYGAGQLTAKMQNGLTKSQLGEAIVKRDAMQERLDAGMFDGKMSSMEAMAEGAKINEMTNTINGLQSKLGAVETFTDPKTGITHQIKSANAIPKTNAAKCGTTATTTTQKEEQRLKETTESKMYELKQLLNQKIITVEEWIIVEELLLICCPSNFTEVAFKMLKQQQQSSTITMEQLKSKTKMYVKMCIRARNGKYVERYPEEDEEDEEKDDEKIRCLHWNICGIAAQLSTDIGLIPFLLMYNPHIILLNEIKAKDWLVDVLAGTLGYRAVYVSSSAPNNRSMRGSAILYRVSEKYTCAPGQGKQMIERNGAPEVEMVWADIKLRGGHQYRLVSAYVLRDAHFEVVAQEFNKLAAASGKVIVIAGDLNMEKSKFAKKWRDAGFTDLLKTNWVTNVTSARGAETCIDYVMVRTGEQSHVRCSPPVRPVGKNFHLPIPFTIGPNLGS